MLCSRKIGHLQNLIKNRSLLLLTRPTWTPLDQVAIGGCHIGTRRFSSAFTTSTLPSKMGAGLLGKAGSLLPPPLLGEPSTFGQPTPTTHPHLLKGDELVPGQTLCEFKKRRLRIIATLQLFAKSSTPSESIKNAQRSHFLVVPAATKKFMSGKTAYNFRQDSNFFYLTGCLEPEAVLLLTIDELTNLKATLFLKQKNNDLEKSVGANTTPEKAVGLFGVTEAFELSQFETVLRTRVQKEKPVIWYDRSNLDHDQITKHVVAIAQDAKSNIRSPAFYLQVMRAKKSLAEQNIMRRTCEITSKAFNNVMKKASIGMTENRLAAMVEYECRKQEIQNLAFPPVVAAGNNATTINYNFNNQITHAGDLILMDAGCDFYGYTSDITRTWPISGQYSEPQKILYEVVLQTQKDLIGSILRFGGESLNALQETMYQKMAKYLHELKVIPANITDEDNLRQAVKRFCPHPVSHYLGLDLYDTELISRNMRLHAGTVLTVAPGIYINAENNAVPKEFRGIGVRLQDDILINNENQVEVLTASCAKERKEIEAIMQKRG